MIVAVLGRDYIRCRVLEEPVVGIEHLARQQVEPLPGHATVVETHFAIKLNPQSVIVNIQTHAFTLQTSAFRAGVSLN